MNKLTKEKLSDIINLLVGRANKCVFYRSDGTLFSLYHFNSVKIQVFFTFGVSKKINEVNKCNFSYPCIKLKGKINDK